MGQYYKAILLDKKIGLKPWDHGGSDDPDENFNGAKLMEHSYIGNPLVNAVENLIKRTGTYGSARVVWAGDYADGEEKNDPDGNNLYNFVSEGKFLRVILPAEKQGRNKEEVRYLVNLSKGEYVDLFKCREDEHGLTIHPLPLLTCEGNGRGGGDYHGEELYIGYWARDRITLQRSKPKKAQEIIPNFNEWR